MLAMVFIVCCLAGHAVKKTDSDESIGTENTESAERIMEQLKD